MGGNMEEMRITHNNVTLAPTSLAHDGEEPSALLETCLATLLMASADDHRFMTALSISVDTWKPPYMFLHSPVTLPDPDPDDWTRPMPQGLDPHGADSAKNLAREYAAVMDVDHACANAMAFSRALRLANANPTMWAYALACTKDGPVSGLNPNPMWGWCSTLARNGRSKGRTACAIAEAIRDGHWGARRVANIEGETMSIPAKVWLALETEYGRIVRPFDDAPDGEPDF